MRPSAAASDKVLYRNRGELQWLISTYKAWRHLSPAGTDSAIKCTAEFKLAQGAVLEISKHSIIQNFCFFQLTYPNPKVYIGNNTVIGRRNNTISAKNLIRIGNNVLIGSEVQIIDHGHGVAKNVPIRKQRALNGEVTIEDDFWIGADAKILMNFHSGTGAIIGASAAVVTDIPDYGIAVGVPARVIKYRE